jgi:hypothetical protein
MALQAASYRLAAFFWLPQVWWAWALRWVFGASEIIRPTVPTDLF